MALFALLAVGAALFAGTFALNNWGYATFGFSGWVAVSAVIGHVVGLAFIGVWAIVEHRR
jgi:hypothetical protein